MCKMKRICINNGKRILFMIIPVRRILVLSFLPLVSIYIGLVLLRNMFLTFVFYHIIVCIFLPFLYIKIFNDNSAIAVKIVLGLNNNIKKGLLVGLLVGAICFFIIFVFFAILKQQLLNVTHINLLLEEWNFSKEWFIFLFFYFIFFNSIIEELFWRGYLYYEYNKLYNIHITSIIVSFFFIQYHLLTICMIFSLKVAIIFTSISFIYSLMLCYLKDISLKIYIRCQVQNKSDPPLQSKNIPPSHLLFPSLISSFFLSFKRYDSPLMFITVA